MSGLVQISVELSEEQALALARFLKRVGWSEMRACSYDEAECYWVREALAAVRRELNEAGMPIRLEPKGDFK